LNRLFTFGCSFTQYWRWPTWADALGYDADLFENWGVCGAGNSLIFNSLIECIQRRRLTADDRVMIMWTSTSREDRYVKNRWLAQGNVYWLAGSELPLEYVSRFACERGYLIRDLALIAAAKMILDDIGCDFRFLSMVDLARSNFDQGLGSNPDLGEEDTSDVIAVYQDVLSIIAPSIHDVVFNREWWSPQGIADSYDPSRRDFHPTPLQHLQYLDLVQPNIPISSGARAWMADCEHQARSGNLPWAEPNRPQDRL
jgi:hypothetical protein